MSVSWIEAVDRRWPGGRRRAGSLGLAIALELLLLIALLSLGTRAGHEGPAGPAVTTFDVHDDRPKAQEQPAQPQQAAAAPRAPSVQQQPSPLTPPAPLPSPAAVILPRPLATPQPPPPAAAPSDQTPAPPKITAVIRSDMASFKGPQGAAGVPGDSQRIAGSGPHGEPLYKAEWYREPSHDQLAGYLSYVHEDAWALIDCQTVAQFKVDHCYLVDEWPEGANMGRATLAAAWQFLVRPPRVGGRMMVGEWVRIRISYDVIRKQR